MEYTQIKVTPVRYNERGFFNEPCELGMQTSWEVLGITSHGRKVLLGEAATQSSAFALAAGYATPVTHGVNNAYNYGTSVSQHQPHDTQLYYTTYRHVVQKPAYGIRRVSEDHWDVISADENRRGTINEPVVVSSHPSWISASDAAKLNIDGVILPDDNLESEYTD